MAIYSGLFNSVNGDRKYNATWFARYFATFIGNGVFPNPSTGLQVLENENMTTIVKPGDGWINGYFIVNDSEHVLTHANADGVLNRIDRVVMQLDYSNRVINILIKQGTFASSPVVPTIQHDVDYYELVLADVYITAGLTTITQANITDQRLNTELCGIVHGTVDQVDTTTLFNQYQSWINQQKGVYEADLVSWTDEQKADFLTWFESIQGILNTDVAGNLLLLIQKNESDIKSLIKNKTDVTVLATGWTLNVATNRYEYVINDTDISIESVVDVNIQLDYLDYAKSLLPACKSDNGTVTLFSSSLLYNNLIVDYRISRQVI